MRGKKALFRRLGIGLICLMIAVCVSACGSQAAESTTTAMKTIGKKASGENVVSLEIVNKTGKKITGFTIKSDDMDDYPANMLKSNDAFVKNQQRTLYYDETDAKTAAKEAAEASGEDEDDAISYTLKLTFADKSTAEAKGLPLDNAELVRIRWDSAKKAPYFSYIDTTTGDSTKTKSLIDGEDDSDDTSASTSTGTTYSTGTTNTGTGTTTRQGTTGNNTTSNRSTTQSTRRSTTTTTTTPSATTSTPAASSSGSSSASASSSSASSSSSESSSGDSAMSSQESVDIE